MKGICPLLREEDELVPKSGWNGAPGLKQCFQMRFRRLLEGEQSLTSLSSVGVTARKKF